MTRVATPSAAHLLRLPAAGSVCLAILVAFSGPALGQDEVPQPEPGDDRGALQVQIVGASEGDDSLHEIIVRRSDGTSRTQDRRTGESPFGWSAPPDDYQVELATADGWVVTGIECSDGTIDEPSIVGGSAKFASVQLTAGEELLCTITVASAQLTVAVETEPEDADETFEFDVEGFIRNPSTGAATGSQYVDQQLEVRANSSQTIRPPDLEGVVRLVGPASVGERWKVESLDCDSASSSASSETDLYHDLEPDSHVTCTWVLVDQTVPKKGRWVVDETAARMDCPDTDLIPDPERGRGRRGSIEIKSGGERLILTGAGRGRVVMKRVTPESGEYKGKRGKARIRWSVVSPERIRGYDKLPGPKRCFIKRSYLMIWAGD